MKKLKTISLLLSLSLLASLVIPVTLATTTRAVGEQENSGMIINKTATANTDGTYTIQLEAFATGDKVITETTKDVPTDIVLVLDQSGSMEEKMNTYSFRAYSGKDNEDYYNLRHNNNSYNANKNLYYKLTDGSYATVSVTRTQGEGASNYTECPADWDNDAYRGTNNYYANKDNLYVKSGEEYKKVDLVRSIKMDSWIYTYTYTYTFPDGSTVESEGSDSSPDFGGKGPLYVRSAAYTYTYTYTYTDSEGQIKTIGTSEGANTQPTDFTLYERYTSSSTTRLAALQTAVTNFANSVKTKAAGPDGDLSTTADNVNHRIAVVGFATGSTSSNYGYPTWENTEVFVGANQYNYSDHAKSYYGSALQDMSTQAGYDNVIASKNALAARGATYPNYGLEMAKGILNANPVQQGETRNRVVILFTDGSPGYSGYDDSVASSAVTTANTLKNNGVTVYSVGIFEGADATSAGNQQGTDEQKANWFMQNVSSNNGAAQNPSYYLSAGDAASLNSIFQQISENIESGGSSTTLSKETVIKDIISDQFELPAGATENNITLETYACTGKDGDSYTWSKNDGRTMGATAAVSDGQVSVTGFDFAENYVGTVTENGTVKYRGHKLVIKFKVKPKAGFLGGNDVYTNTSAGVYENSSATKPVLTFNRPQVNVAIEDVTVTAADKNVYLLSDLTADQIKDGATVKCGNVELNLSEANQNYGLKAWQTEYVDITVTVKDKDGNVISDKLDNLTDDTTYTVEVTVEPKTVGTSTTAKGDAATAKTGVNDPAANIYVFKPELKFMDSSAYYGETIPTNNNYSSNRVGTEKWMHDSTEAVPGEMLGTKPTLNISFTPDESKLENGKYTKQDVPVTATVKIGTKNVNDYTTFVHQDCTTACGWATPAKPGAPAFLIHIQTCTLNITKQGGAVDESYVFDVFKDGEKYTEISVWGNGSETIYELPVGSYTIQENAGWSWRYEAEYKDSPTVLTAKNPTGSITCNNRKTENYWLNGFSTIVKNISGVENSNEGEG